MSNADTRTDGARRDDADVPPLSTSSQIGHFIKWKRAIRHTALLHEAGYLLLGLVSLATVTGLYFWLDVPLVAAAFTYLVVLVLLSLVSSFSSLIVLSFIGVCCLNYFFTPPIYTFRVDYSQDLITISAFVITSFIVNFLVTRVQVEKREHKRAEQALRERDAKIRRLVDANIIGIIIWDFDGRVLEANETFLDIVGYDHEDIVAGRLRWTDLTPPEWRDRDTRLIEEHKATGTLRPFEKEYFRKDGSRVPVLIGVATFEEGGDQGIAFVLDLTERKCAEKALQKSEAKFRDYAETASDWFWEIGPDYIFTLLSENAFGSGSADRIGTACWDHALDLEMEPEKWRFFRATLDSREPFRDFVYRVSGGNGSPMYVKVGGKPVCDCNGGFLGYRGTGIDVTALMRAQQEHERLRRLESDLAHMNRLTTMGELTASLAHEITQPIATARNNARAAVRFLDRSPPDLSEVREALNCIVADADRAGDIIKRIRDQIQKAPPRNCCFDLNEAIDEVIRLARSAITTNGVSVRTRLADAPLPVRGDRVQLQQVLLNLILNALEAMSTVEAGPRELLISTEQTPTGGVLVSVRDSGPGIDPDHLDRVFEAFYTTKSSGIGMGLSICRSIINTNGGRLWVENASRGAEFQFTLPSAEEELTNPLPPAHRTGEPREDTVSDPRHQLACEGNKRSRPSGREHGRRHSGRPS